MKYGHADLLPPTDLAPLSPEGERAKDTSEADKAEELAADLEAMGPLFIKLGQVLSSRPDLLPIPYTEALTRLQDRVAPFSFEEVKETIQQELGVRLSKAFSEFEAEPIAVASLGQVHRAALREGRKVAVKVQRPGIRQQIAADMEVLEEIAESAAPESSGSRRRF